MVAVQIYDRTYLGIGALIFDKDGTLAQSQDYLAAQAKARFDAVIARCLNALLKEDLQEDLQDGIHNHPRSDLLQLPLSLPDHQGRSQFSNSISIATLQAQIFASWGVSFGQVDPAGLLAVGSKRQNAIVTAGYLTPFGLGWIEALQQVEEAFAQVSLSPEEKARLTPPIPDLQPQLDRLRQSGLKLVLLSADTEENVRAFAKTWNLTDRFDLLMGEQPGLPKPNPALLHAVCDRLQLAPSEVLVLGDSDADIQLAKLSGAAGAIAYPAGWPTIVALPQADQDLKQLCDLKIIIKSIS